MTSNLLRRIPRPSLVEIGALVSIVAIGFWTRVPGFSRYDLWFDDAWAALPAKVTFATANKMVATTPAYSLAMRSWLQLGPKTTIWAQIPSFVFAMVGIIAIYALVRYFTFSRNLGLLASLVIAVGPVTSLYATRMKEYAADFLIACCVLAAAEAWRRRPTWQAATTLGAVGSVSLLVSAQTLLVTGAALLMMVLSCLADRSRLRHTAGVMSAVVLTAVVAEVLWFSHIVPQLSANWTNKGYMLDVSSLHRVLFSVEHMLSGLGHGFLGLVIPYSFNPQAASPVAVLWAVVVGVVFVFLIALALVPAVKRWRTGPSPLVAPALVLVAAAVGAVAQMTPFGGGRTDEVLYPALIVMLCAALTWARQQWSLRRGVVLTVCSVSALSLVTFGALHTARYPEVDLRSIAAQLGPALLPGDRVVVDGYASFTWAHDDLSPWRVNFAQGTIPWPMGFHATSTKPDVTMSGEYLQPDDHTEAVFHTGHRLWYVTITIGASSPYAPKGLLNFPLPTPTRSAMLAAGWQPTTMHLSATHADASLFTHR